MTTIDFNRAIQDAKGASFEALPIGDYDVEVAKTEAVTSSNNKPMIKTTFRVVSGPYEKRPIISQFVLSVENPQAVAIFFRHMKAFGLTEEWFASLGQQASLGPVADALLGRRARLTLGHREWQGEMRNEVKSVKPYTGAPPVAPVGPTAPGAGGPVAPGPVTGPAPLPPAPPVGAQIQPMPQPPAPAVPTSTSASAPVPVAEAPAAGPIATSSDAPPHLGTSDAPTPPAAPPTLPL